MGNSATDARRPDGSAGECAGPVGSWARPAGDVEVTGCAPRLHPFDGSAARQDRLGRGTRQKRTTRAPQLDLVRQAFPSFGVGLDHGCRMEAQRDRGCPARRHDGRSIRIGRPTAEHPRATPESWGPSLSPSAFAAYEASSIPAIGGVVRKSLGPAVPSGASSMERALLPPLSLVRSLRGSTEPRIVATPGAVGHDLATIPEGPSTGMSVAHPMGETTGIGHVERGASRRGAALRTARRLMGVRDFPAPAPRQGAEG